MEDLVELLCGGEPVLFITGAGLSVHSGIPPYRGRSDAIWSSFVTSWATRRRFLKDPLRWWNEFYLATHYKAEYLGAEPNRGHDALAHIVQRCAGAKIITQNVDGLHRRGTGAVDDDLVIEAHGSMHGGFKCINKSCPLVEECIDEEGETIDLISLAEVPGSKPGDADFKLSRAPLCPSCNDPILPQCLLFDEDYCSHPFYEWGPAQQWMEDAKAIVFVGTSFSVGLTNIALEEGRTSGQLVFNVNLEHAKDLRPVDARRMRHLIGPSEEILPLLAYTVGKRFQQLSDSGTTSERPTLWRGFAPKHYIWVRDAQGNLKRQRAKKSRISLDRLQREYKLSEIAAAQAREMVLKLSPEQSRSRRSKRKRHTSTSLKPKSTRSGTYGAREKRRKRPSCRYQIQLNQLASMGFQDEERNLMLLQRKSGVVGDVVKLLFRENAHVIEKSSSSCSQAAVAEKAPAVRRGRKSERVRRRVDHGPLAVFVKGIWILNVDC